MKRIITTFIAVFVLSIINGFAQESPRTITYGGKEYIVGSEEYKMACIEYFNKESAKIEEVQDRKNEISFSLYYGTCCGADLNLGWFHFDYGVYLPKNEVCGFNRHLGINVPLTDNITITPLIGIYNEDALLSISIIGGSDAMLDFGNEIRYKLDKHFAINNKITKYCISTGFTFIF